MQELFGLDMDTLAAGLGLALAGALATFLPAVQAARIPPAAALRYE